MHDDHLPEPAQVRRLRRLVSLLTAVMIVGMVVVATTMVIRLGSFGAAPSVPARVDAARLSLPEGASIVAVGRGGAGILVVTRDADGAETLRVFDPGTGTETSATPIVRE